MAIAHQCFSSFFLCIIERWHTTLKALEHNRHSWSMNHYKSSQAGDRHDEKDQATEFYGTAHCETSLHNRQVMREQAFSSIVLTP